MPCGRCKCKPIGPSLRLFSLAQSGLHQPKHPNVFNRVHGSLESPEVEGAAVAGKATILCPYLRFPITNAGGTMRLSDNMLTVWQFPHCSEIRNLCMKHCVVSYTPDSIFEHTATSSGLIANPRMCQYIIHAPYRLMDGLHLKAAHASHALEPRIQRVSFH